MGQVIVESAALTADWLATLSERARADGAIARADRLLLLAWQAFDGQEITPEMLTGIEDADPHPAPAEPATNPVGASKSASARG